MVKLLGRRTEQKFISHTWYVGLGYLCVSYVDWQKQAEFSDEVEQVGPMIQEDAQSSYWP